MKQHVRIFIQAGFWTGIADFEAVLPLPEPLVLQKVDLPELDSDGFTRMLCSDTATIRTVMLARAQIAKILEPVITKALMDAMGAQDTECGYPKDKSK